MDGLIALAVLVALGLAAVTLVLPIVALHVSRRTARQLRSLEAELHATRARLEFVEARFGRPVEPAPGPGAEPAPLAPPTPRAPIDLAPVAEASPLPSAVPPPVSAKPVTSARDWESLIGVRLFAWLGGGALFLGTALFLSYSIQHDLVSPPVRVATGIVFGAGALWLGDRLRARTNNAGQGLSGAGVATLYASLFAARSLYHLIETTPTFIAMALVTLVAGVVAVKRNAFMLAILGLVGGMATPYLLSTGEDRPIALFAYVVMLDIGIVDVTRRKRWPLLGLLGLAGSAILYAGWSLAYLDAERVPYALGAGALLAALFALTQSAPTGQRDRLGRLTSYAAAMAPMLLALVVGVAHRLTVEPTVLVLYLVVIGAGAWVVARRLKAPALVAAAAVFATVTLAVRVESDLFPLLESSTLAIFAIVPAAFFAGWFGRRNGTDAPLLRLTAAFALAGVLFIVWRVVSVEPRDHPIFALALFAGAHVLGLAVLGLIGGEGVYVAVSQAVAILVFGKLSERFTLDRLNEFLPFVVIPMAAFWALPLVTPRLRKSLWAWISSAVALPVHFAFIYFMAEPSWGRGPLGTLAVACAALSLVMLGQARKRVVGDMVAVTRLSALFGAETLLFVSAAVPILLRDEWTTVAWATEAAALAWLNRRVQHRGLVAGCAGLAAAAFVRLAINPAVWEYHPRVRVPVLNFYLYAFGAPVLAFFAAAHFLGNDRTAGRLRLVPLLRVAAVVLLFVLLNVEIADAYSTGAALTFNFAGGGLGQDMGYSLAWGVFALSLLVFGIAAKQKPPRIGALGFLTLTIVKVFLHDLWELGSLYRVGSIVGLAFALLAVSFLTQRFILRAEIS